MENENENLDDLSEFDENDNSLNENQDDLAALQKEKQELSDKNRRLFERAKKSETELKELRKKSEEFEKKLGEKPVSQSNEPDYGKLAFLNSKGIDHTDDVKIAMEEAERLKLPLTDVLQMEHIQARLKVNKETREAQVGMPKGGNRSGGHTPNDVEYHLAKGTTPDDQELAEKVIDARMNKESQNKFSDMLYNE